MEELDVFYNEKVPNSRVLNEPPETGVYLILGTSITGKTEFQIVYYRNDTKKFYLNLDCPKDRGLTDFWRIEVEEWILLKKLPISAFED